MRPHRPASVRSFRHRDAAALGVTANELRGPTWDHPVSGVALDASVLHHLASRCHAVQLILPTSAVWTHLTAAKLLGWWLPQMLEESTPMIVSALSDDPHLDRRGVYVRRVDVPAGHRTEVHGLRLASAAWVIAELAEDLGLIDLVVVIDCALHTKAVTLPELWAVCVKGRRGVRTLRQAIRLADGRSESAWETILRLLHVLSGVTDVHPQPWLCTDAGVFVARADLRIGKTRRLHEYDGGEHRKRKRHEADLEREKRLVRDGWVRCGYTAAEIIGQPEQIVRDAVHALGQSFHPAQLATWRYEVARSSLSADGRRRLARRLRRFDRTSPPRRVQPPA